MYRKIFVISFLCLAICWTAWAEHKTLKLKSGMQVTGEVTKTDTGYHVVTKYSEMNYPDSEVLEVVEEMTPAEEYKHRLAEIDPNSADQHMELGQWALNEQLYEQAAKEFKAVLAIRPNNEQAALMLQQVERMIARQGKRTGTTRPTTATATSSFSPAGEEAIKEDWLLNDDDINRVRVEELRADDKVRIEFADDVITRFINMMRNAGDVDFRNVDAERLFRGKTPIQKAIIMLDKIDRENTSIKNGIRVMTDPRFMEEYRQFVKPVVQQCAAVKCHGGDEAVGGMKLLRSVGRDNRVDYTNFVILDGMTSRDGKARVIDRSNPERSLILQYGLLSDEAEYRHPVKLPRPIFTGRNSPSYRRIRDWIATLRGPLHPDYKLEYSPPFGMKLTYPSAPLPGPATRPTAAPVQSGGRYRQ